MGPTPTPQQVSAKWGDPNWVQQFRSQALSTGAAGISQVDNYIAQNQAAYQLQQKNAVQNTIGQNQGGMTPDQATANPVAASQFIGNGGSIINTGTDAQAKYINDAQKQFQKAKGKNKYVDPNTYNTIKAGYAATGGDEPTFDAKFGQYTDPNKIDYNTPDARARMQQYDIAKAHIQKTLDQFNKIPSNQKGNFSPDAYAASIPFLNQFLAPQAASYENTKQGLAATLSPAFGGGSGSGLKINLPELQAWAGFLPGAANAPTYNNSNISKLNDALTAKFGGHGLDQQYLPQNAQTANGYKIIQVK